MDASLKERAFIFPDIPVVVQFRNGGCPRMHCGGATWLSSMGEFEGYR